MTDLPDAGPPTGAGWTDEVDEHLTEAREHIDIAQDAVAHDQATTDREQAATDRTQATTDRDQATTDREKHAVGVEQATTDRDQATTDRVQATVDRDQATTDRDQATTDRDQATTDRNESRARGRTSRDDVATLAGSVTELAKSVAGLHALIRLSLEKADQAHAEAAANPSRKRVYMIAAGLAAFALALAGTGAFVVHEQQAQNYRACNERNAAQDQSDAFLGRLNAAVQKSRPGSLLARNLGDLLTPDARADPHLVVCHRPFP